MQRFRVTDGCGQPRYARTDDPHTVVDIAELLLAGHHGWDYLVRYVRAWRDDPWVRSRAPVPGASLEARATFVAAAISAAVGVDLRARFESAWRFPVQGGLFDDLYAHFLTETGVPW